jgi:hypothetical protein
VPTKIRKTNEKAKKQSQAEFNKAFADCVKLTGVDPFEDLHKLTRRKNLVVYDKDDGIPESHPQTGKGGNDMRRNERRDIVLYLQNKYKDKWHLRGAAKAISIDENLTLRTVQRYIKDYPIY